MKRRHVDPADGCDPEALLLRALSTLQGPVELGAFLRDLCTPAELEALCDRWRVVPHLLRGTAYREIHELTGVSVTTIGRVARFLAAGNGGYRLAAQRLCTDTTPTAENPVSTPHRVRGAAPASASALRVAAAYAVAPSKHAPAVRTRTRR